MVFCLGRLPRFVQVLLQVFLGFPRTSLAGRQNVGHRPGYVVQQGPGHHVVLAPVEEDPVHVPVTVKIGKSR